MPYKNSAARNAYARAWYHKNKAAHVARVRVNNHRHRDWLRAQKTGKACARCTESDPNCLDWHHLDPLTKEFEVGTSHSRAGKKRTLAEIAKCILLCANCHRKEHAAQRSTVF